MARTYTQLYIHVVFAVQNRSAIIERKWKEELHRYLTSIVQQNNHKMIQINTMPDHIHLLLSLMPHQSLSSLIKILKVESTKWIKQKQFCAAPFNWQEGFGAFTYSKSQIDQVIRYIQNQEIHHRKKSFSEEYKSLLSAFEIDWKEQHIFLDLQ